MDGHQAYLEWLTFQSGNTWVTVTFDEWKRSGLGGAQISWDAWAKKYRPEQPLPLPDRR